MAVKPTAPRVMNGKWGMVYLDGEPVYETDSYEAKVKIEREDVDFVMQMAKDSKMTGLTGEWSMKVKKVFSRGAQLLSEKIKHGQDVRIQIISKIDDPDAYGSERLVIENALNYLLKKETILEYGELVEAVIDGQNVWADDLNIEFFREWIDLSNQYTEYDFIEEWNKTRSRMIRQLEFIKMSLNKGLILDDIKILEELECFGSAGGAGDVAILASIYLASRYANNPSTGIKISAFTVGMDTDTIASITGGLLGMLNGMNWIPMQWRNVQDYECLIRMAEVLLKEDKRKAAEEANEIKSQDGQWVATPIGKMKFVEFKNVPNGQHGTVRIEKWYTMLGQTLYTKKFYPKDMQLQSETHEKVYQQNQNKQFMLTLADVDDLLNNPDFKKNITIGKVLKIIKSLINDKHTVAAIAKQLNVEQSVVEQINDYVIFKGDKN